MFHWLGFDGSWTTDAWGGFISCIGMFAAVIAFLRHHNCVVRWCPRLGRHKVDGTEHYACRRHHPEGHQSMQDIHAAWKKGKS